MVSPDGVPPQIELDPDKSVIMIGRDERADIRITSGYVGRTQCILTFDPATASWMIHDNNATGGTGVNDVRLAKDEKIKLTPGAKACIISYSSHVTCLDALFFT